MARNQNLVTETQRALRGAEYPLAKGDLIEIAKSNEASEEVLDILEGLPDVDFEGVTDVQEAVGEDIRSSGNKSSENASSHESEGDWKGGHTSRSEVESKKENLKEETGKLTEPGKNVTGEPDRRLKGQESDAIAAARHMEHGYDGRGRIRNPEMDARLAENRAKPENTQMETEPKEGNQNKGQSRMTWKQLQSNIGK